MEILKDYLPKDLINIVEEYAKDRIQYDNTIKDLERMIEKINAIPPRSLFYNPCLSKALLERIRIQKRFNKLKKFMTKYHLEKRKK